MGKNIHNLDLEEDEMWIWGEVQSFKYANKIKLNNDAVKELLKLGIEAAKNQ